MNAKLTIGCWNRCSGAKSATREAVTPEPHPPGGGGGGGGFQRPISTKIKGLYHPENGRRGTTGLDHSVPALFELP